MDGQIKKNKDSRQSYFIFGLLSGLNLGFMAGLIVMFMICSTYEDSELTPPPIQSDNTLYYNKLFTMSVDSIDINQLYIDLDPSADSTIEMLDMYLIPINRSGRLTDIHKLINYIDDKYSHLFTETLMCDYSGKTISQIKMINVIVGHDVEAQRILIDKLKQEMYRSSMYPDAVTKKWIIKYINHN